MNDGITQRRGGQDHTDPDTGRAKVQSEMRKELTVKCVQQPVKAEPAVWRSQLNTDIPKTIFL